MRRLALVVLLATAPSVRGEVPGWTDEPVALQRLIESAHRAKTAGNRLGWCRSIALSSPRNDPAPALARTRMRSCAT